MMALPDRILITGASGFIGGRLAERLAIDHGLRPRVLVRDPRRIPWLSRFPVDLASGDVTDETALAQACHGVDVVVHCAASGSTDHREAFVTNVQGTRAVLTAAQRGGVGRLVHVSTTAVHGLRLPAGVTEDSPLAPSSDAYAQTKTQAEQAVWACHRRSSLPVVVVRPALVYGPRSSTWTVGPALRLLAGKAAVVGDGAGIANLTYIDNLVDLLLLAVVEPKAVGRAYLAADGEGLTWRQFWDAFAQALSCPRPGGHSAPAVALGQTLSRQATHLTDVVTRRTKGMVGLGLALTTKLVRRMTAKVDVLGGVPLDVYRNRALVRPTRAMSDLGYVPRVSFAAGLEDCCAWLRFHGYVRG